MNNMEEYKIRFSQLLADSGALFFRDGLVLKDKRPTPYFVNIGGFAEKASFRLEFAKAFAGMIKGKIDQGMNIDIVFGPSYKGIPIAADVTTALLNDYGIDLGFCFDRKEVKNHGDAVQGKVFVGAKFFDGCNIYMVDDVGTSMNTKREGLEKIVNESKGLATEVVGIGISVDREQVGPVYDKDGDIVLGARGEDAIGNFIEETGISVDSIASISEVVECLFQLKYPLMINDIRKPLDKKKYNEFKKYMKTYGIRRES